MQVYFTDREQGPRPRTVEAIDERVWGGLYALISARLNDDSLGYRFPESCPDGYGPCGYDHKMLQLTAAAEIPEIDWPLQPEAMPSTSAVMDLLEFVAASIGEPEKGSWHSFFAHHHLSWDRETGLRRFAADVNRLFARNGVAFELGEDGVVRRLLPEPLRDALASTLLRTGDAETDRLLEAARKLILAPDLNRRRDALEKLWDAFERLKTLEPGPDKRAQADALLDRAAGPAAPRLRALIGEEAKALTDIGNSFRIRHSETSQELPTTPEQIDYLFQRMFAFVRMVLKTTGRGG